MWLRHISSSRTVRRNRELFGKKWSKKSMLAKVMLLNTNTVHDIGTPKGVHFSYYYFLATKETKNERKSIRVQRMNSWRFHRSVLLFNTVCNPFYRVVHSFRRSISFHSDRESHVSCVLFNNDNNDVYIHWETKKIATFIVVFFFPLALLRIERCLRKSHKCNPPRCGMNLCITANILLLKCKDLFWLYKYLFALLLL